MSEINKVRIKFYAHAGQNIDNCYSSMLDLLTKIVNDCIDAGSCTGVNEFEVFTNFNGAEITTSMDIDECYKAVTGKTKAEWNEIERKAKEEHERKENEFNANKSSLIEQFLDEAKSYIPEELHDELEKVTKDRFDDIYHGMDMTSMLDIIKLYKETSDMDKCAELFYNQGHSGWSAGIVKFLLTKFHSKELGDYVYDNSLKVGKKDE